MASVVDLLRRANREEMASKPVRMEVKRLSEVFGEPFIFELKPVSCAAWQKLLDSDVEYRTSPVRHAREIPAPTMAR